MSGQYPYNGPGRPNCDRDSGTLGLSRRIRSSSPRTIRETCNSCDRVPRTTNGLEVLQQAGSRSLLLRAGADSTPKSAKAESSLGGGSSDFRCARPAPAQLLVFDEATSSLRLFNGGRDQRDDSNVGRQSRRYYDIDRASPVHTVLHAGLHVRLGTRGNRG